MSKETVTVTYLGVELEVSGVYSPEDPMVMYYQDGSGYPGSSSEFEITSVEIGGQNAEEIIDKLYAWNDLVELAIKKIEE